jgi:hypothetical protein
MTYYTISVDAIVSSIEEAAKSLQVGCRRKVNPGQDNENSLVFIAFFRMNTYKQKKKTLE